MQDAEYGMRYVKYGVRGEIRQASELGGRAAGQGSKENRGFSRRFKIGDLRSFVSERVGVKRGVKIV
jgi:hypothetical protein